MKTNTFWILLILLFNACGGAKGTTKQPQSAVSNQPIIQQTPPKSQTSFTTVEGNSQGEDTSIYEKYRIAKPTIKTAPNKSVDTGSTAPALRPSEKHGLMDDLPKK